MTGRREFATLITLATVLLGGCFLPAPQVEVVPFANPEAQISVLALTRTTWDQTRPDPFCQPEIGNDIDWHLKKGLEKRGYTTLSLQVPDLDNSNRPDPVATWGFEQLKGAAPEKADAIMRLRVVEYLDGSLCDSGYEMKSLGITAITEIYSMHSGQKIWESRQLCNDLSGKTSDVVFACTTQLARRIVGSLPPAAP